MRRQRSFKCSSVKKGVLHRIPACTFFLLGTVTHVLSTLLLLQSSVTSLSTTKTLPRTTTSRTIAESAQERRQQSLHVGHNPLLSLNLNLDAMARAQAAERAQELYQRIAALHQEGYYATAPDVVSFNSVLKAWQNQPARALEFWELASGQLTPNVRSYNTFLLALAKAGLYKPARVLLQQMESSTVLPDCITYNTVLLAYCFCHSEEAAGEADRLLRFMLSPHSTVQPNVISFNTVLAALLHSTHAATQAEEWLQYIKAMPGIQPDVYTYTTVLQIHVQAGNAPRALELLQEMQKVGQQPNRVTYTIVMQALCNNGQLTAARSILDEMIMTSPGQQQRPDCIAFSALLAGYAKHNMPWLVVQELLEQMKEYAVEWPDCAPNQQTYTSVLSALASCRLYHGGLLADQYLQEMWDTDITPSVIHYNAALNVWAKSNRADKVVYAERLWYDMQAHDIACDVITYNTLLAVTGSMFGTDLELKQTALQLASSVFRTLQQDDSECQATSLTFHYWFKTLRKLVPPSAQRSKLVQQAFRLCCQQGCLNTLVLNYVLQYLVTSREQQQALGLSSRNNIQIQDLPPKWSRHAMKDRKQHGRRRRP